MGSPVPVAPRRLEVQTPAEPRSTLDADLPQGLISISVDEIEPSRFQPRRIFDQVSLERLADSIKSTGMMQPVILRPGSGGVKRYELVAGERRWRAAVIANLPSVPSLVRELSDEQAAEWAIVENVQREDLNPMERAWAYRGLTERFHLTHQQVAERVGLDRSTIANTIRLTELEEPIRDMIQANRLSAGHGKALLLAPPGPERIKLAEQASDESWSVRRLERAAAALASPEGTPPAPAVKSAQSDRDLSRIASRTSLEKQLSEHLGTKVTITTNRAGDHGRLSIEFYGLEHFDGLLAKLGFHMQ
jgi:ParB family chromosome partitioning protein